jgi:hypothetical protein
MSSEGKVELLKEDTLQFKLCCAAKPIKSDLLGVHGQSEITTLNQA